MPSGALRECRVPRCPNYQYRDGFCAAHQSAAKLDRSRELNLLPGNRRFRKLRAAFLMRNPMCNDCKREPATDLDHIVPHRGDVRLFWAQSNWQGLCHRCHGRKTYAETLGGGNALRDRGGVKNLPGTAEIPPLAEFLRVRDWSRGRSL